MSGTDTSAGHRNSLLRQVTESKMLLLMCLPAIAFFVVFNYAPLPGIWIQQYRAAVINGVAQVFQRQVVPIDVQCLHRWAILYGTTPSPPGVPPGISNLLSVFLRVLTG